MPPPIVILEPLSTGDIIDRSIGIYRRNVRPLLATVTVPFVIGALGWLMVQFANNAMTSSADGPASAALPVAMLLAGLLFSFVYAYLMVLAVAGLSRTVGDYVMLGEPITVRAAVRAVRARLGALTVGSIILAAGAMVGTMVATAILVAALFVVGVVGLAVQNMGLPQFVAGTVIVLVMIAALGAVFFVVVPLLLSRLVFIPHAIMIEGCSGGAALARSMSLGARNWNRVLAILAFSYFASWSLAAAVLAPVLLLLWLSGHLSFDLETFDAVTGGINQFSSFLVVPVWSIAYTLLYFDNRVRKEAYDVDLLVRRLPPPPPRPAQAPAAPQPYAAPFPPAPAASAQVKFAPDGRCLRCGRYNLFASRNCPGCGW